jgi:hypothetical protein
MHFYLAPLDSAQMPSFHTEDLEFEGSSYIGIILSAIFYGQLACCFITIKNAKLISIDSTGIYLGIYCLSIHALLINPHTNYFRQNFFVFYTSILLLLNTVYFMGMPHTGQVMWTTPIDDHPGGSFTYYNTESPRTPIILLSNIAQTLAATLNSGLLESSIFYFHSLINQNTYVFTFLLVRHIVVTLYLAPDFTLSYFRSYALWDL